MSYASGARSDAWSASYSGMRMSQPFFCVSTLRSTLLRFTSSASAARLCDVR